MAAPQYHQASFQPISTDGHRGSVSTHSSHSVASLDSSTPQASRNIFIQYLSQDTTPRHLKEYLESAGTVEKCEIQERKPVSGRVRTFAAATFQTVQEAKQAIASLDNSLFRGAKIRVRFDREAGGTGSSGSSTATKTASTASSGSPPTPTRSGDNMTAKRGSTASIGENGERNTERSKMSSTEADGPKNTRDSPSLGKNNSEPLVVNGSCVGLKAGRTNVDMVCNEGVFINRSSVVLFGKHFPR